MILLTDIPQWYLFCHTEPPWFPFRYVLVLLLFFGFFNASATRLCFNIALVAMVNFTEPLKNVSDECSNLPSPAPNSTSQASKSHRWTYENTIRISLDYVQLECLTILVCVKICYLTYKMCYRTAEISIGINQHKAFY